MTSYNNDESDLLNTMAQNLIRYGTIIVDESYSIIEPAEIRIMIIKYDDKSYYARFYNGNVAKIIEVR